MALRIDLHVHTKYSHDSSITLKDLALYSKAQGLDGVAITDHDTTKGFREFRRIENLLIIPGAEITTDQGHVLAINVTASIRNGLSFMETIDQIHCAGGVAISAHPTTLLRATSEQKLRQGFDAMEVINSSAVPFSLSVFRNRRIATMLGLPQTGGSDAHYGPEVGMAYTQVEAEADVDEVVETIRRGAISAFGRSIPWSIRLKRILCRT